jgi:sulfate permease, SulP family
LHDIAFRDLNGFARALSSKLGRILPIAEWLPRYDRQWLRADLVAGVTIWALVIPQAMAYAHIAGLPPQAGIFVSFAAPLAYALFGTSKQLVCGAISSAAIISAAHISTLAAGDPATFATLSAALAIICGAIFILLGLFRLGFVSQFIAAPVQTGFLFGLGLIIIVGQLFEMFGLAGTEGPFYEQAWYLLTHIGDTHGWTFAIGAGSLAVLLALRRMAPGFPAALGVVAMSIILISLLDLADRGVQVIGTIGRTFPTVAVPTIAFDQIPALLPAALAIVVIGYSESITIARRFASEHRDQIRPNQELTALGMSNIATGLFHGFVVSGVPSQSAANDRAGAKTQVSSLVLASLAVLTGIALLPLIENLPLAVLGAIVVNAVLGFLNIPAMRRLWAIRRESFALAMAALIGVLVFGLLVGLLVAVTLSILLMVMHLSRPRASEVARLPGTDTFVATQHHPNAVRSPGLLIIRPDDPLLFFNVTGIRDALKTRIVSAETPPRVVVLDLQETSSLDITSLDTLMDLQRDMSASGVELWLRMCIRMFASPSIRPRSHSRASRAPSTPRTGRRPPLMTSWRRVTVDDGHMLTLKVSGVGRIRLS